MGNGSMLSQEEIDALLRGTSEPAPAETEQAEEIILSNMEKDALGEIANISMGTAATTLSLLLNRKVEITTPRVDVTNSEKIREEYPIPCLIVNVEYRDGIEGSNLLILSQRDGSVIVDLMMGGDGTNPDSELSELQISGISEAMNQMMGSAATSMSQIFDSVVDITPPNLVLHDLSKEQDYIQQYIQNEPLVRISFRMVVGNVIDSNLVQILPLSVAKKMASKLLGALPDGEAPSQTDMPDPAVQTAVDPAGAEPAIAFENSGSQPQYAGSQPQTATGYASQEIYNAPLPPAGVNGGAYSPNYAHSVQPTPVQPAQFAPLQPGTPAQVPENLNIILDVPLQISVELGKAKKTIKEILEMGPGSVIELERLAGEPVDMIVNGKLIAKCEVVVVNETFGIRITDIVQPAERMKSFG